MYLFTPFLPSIARFTIRNPQPSSRFNRRYVYAPLQTGEGTVTKKLILASLRGQEHCGQVTLHVTTLRHDIEGQDKFLCRASMLLFD